MSSSGKKCQSSFDAALFGLSLDRASRLPLHVQLVDALRRLILRRDTPGLRLPGSRALAAELSLSRMTVTMAYDQLTSEGYLTARRGSGTFVAEHLPHLAAPAPSRRSDRAAPSGPEPRRLRPFAPGLPDPSLFPYRLWARHLEASWRSPEPALLALPGPFGWWPLRQAIALHLEAWRGLDCHAGQIVITAGASEAIEILAQALLPRGGGVAIEDPGWQPVRDALVRAGLDPVPQRIDTHGLDAAALPDGLAAVFVTPSRHYPTGVVMPLARRIALLDKAARHGTWIVEDDYDSEFRYVGQPVPSMAGLDGLGRTIYLGSFSKLLSPALRLGYAVLPEVIVPDVRAHLARVGGKASIVPQPALAGLMQSGDFAAHLRRMRRTYARRQAVLVAALEEVADLIDLGPDPGGMHLCCALKPAFADRVADTEVARAASEAGLTLRALSTHAILPDPPQALLLGYAAFDDDSLRAAARTLVGILRGLARGG